jgi:anti-anti-sigma factor
VGGAAAPRPSASEIRRASREAAGPRFEREGAVLRVAGSIGYDLNEEFRDRCEELLSSEGSELTLDLSGVEYLSSTQIGVIADVLARAKRAEKSATLRAAPKVARILKLAGLDRLGQIVPG